MFNLIKSFSQNQEDKNLQRQRQRQAQQQTIIQPQRPVNILAQRQAYIPIKSQAPPAQQRPPSGALTAPPAQQRPPSGALTAPPAQQRPPSGALTAPPAQQRPPSGALTAPLTAPPAQQIPPAQQRPTRGALTAPLTAPPAQQRTTRGALTAPPPAQQRPPRGATKEENNAQNTTSRYKKQQQNREIINEKKSTELPIVPYISSKESFRENCNQNLPLINQINVDNLMNQMILDNKVLKETVLIEFRQFPHLEFLLKNTMIKLPLWTHTVVCGNLNYDYITNLFRNLRVNIIRLDIDNLTPSKYSELLLTKEFWELFKSDKILLYQEDSMLFHGNIDPFLKYDYVGAAWPVGQDDNALGVGNGGFSLRTRAKMIECIEKVNPLTDLQIGNSTIRYMRNTNSVFLPEDVYFSKSLIDYNLGLVAPRTIANNFSQETQSCKKPLGGHNFWLASNKKTYLTNLILENEFYKSVQHRGGWNTVISNLINKGIIKSKTNANSIKFVDCVESRFAWDPNQTPITENWVGIIHYSPNLPSFIKYDLDYILNNKAVLQSLPYCKGLIVLSESNLKHIKSKPHYSQGINIISLKHPVEEIAGKFVLETFLQKKEYSIIQLGMQDRKITTIYTLKTKFKKIWLPGRDNAFDHANNEAKHLNIQIKPTDVDIVYFKEHNEFDTIIQNNIVIIPLWSASANNSIMEIIEMNIPAFVTRLPATEEYLGKDYPMFYTENKEIEVIINNRKKLEDKIKETHHYLTCLDKREFKLDYFNSELLRFIFSL
jgi:hypothetical protein